MAKPVVGITPCTRVDDYVESVRRAGGEPFLLDPTDDPARSLDHVDALLLTGGDDVDPALYGEAPHPTTEVDAARDRFEIPLSRDAVARDMPVFAICRGAQVLNVAAGGTLVQDIPSTVVSELAHSIDLPKNQAVSEDGVVEAIERPASTFCVGVQWHPENFWRTGEFAGLFAEFVAAATRQRTRADG